MVPGKRSDTASETYPHAVIEITIDALITTLKRVDANFEVAASRRGFSGYWKNVAPLFDEGFEELGLDLVH